MVIFGGFEHGQRINTLASFSFTTQEWVHIEPKGAEAPPPRAGHSAVIYGDKMWIFGGKSNDNDKLLDLWSFDFAKQVWQQIKVEMENGGQVTIVGRSGHSATIYEGHMIVFAGIHEVTHELDDMAAFNFGTGKWLHMFMEPNMQQAKCQDSISPPKNQGSRGKEINGNSPQRISDISIKKHATQNQVIIDTQTSKTNKKGPAKKKKGLAGTFSTAGATQGQAPSPKKKQESDPNDYSILSDVTSITMMNSILIKNAGLQFDNYHKAHMAMKKQKTMFDGGNSFKGAHGAGMGGQPGSAIPGSLQHQMGNS